MAFVRQRRRGWAILLFSAIVGMAMALVLAQAVAVRVADHRLSDYSYTLLRHAVDVAQTSRSVMRAVDASRDPPCSDADLDAMRHLSFRAEYLRDVGRVENGALACTALWGKLASTMKLPLPHRVQGNGDLLWEHIDTIGPFRMNVDVAAQGGAIVFTSPFAFKPYETRTDEFAGLVLTHDGRYIYRAYGDVAGLRGLPGTHPSSVWYDLGTHRVWSECVDEVDICVVGGLARIGIFHLPAWLWAGVAVLGGLLGAAIGLAALLRREAGATLPERIRRSVALGGLRMVYQPLVRIRDRRIVGVEALARLTSLQGEAIPPDVFIKVAEEQGLIGDITRRVIRIALEEMRPRLLARRDFYCSINLSMIDILDPDLCDYLNAEVARNGLNPRQIILEITERSTADHSRLVECMRNFRGHGYKFYIDDFGTGYSSLAYLAKLPINGVKIDRMFTDAIGREAVSSLIVQNVCAVASALGTRIILEGVETPGQAAYIQHIAPEAIGQGWLFAEPMTAACINQLPLEFLPAGLNKDTSDLRFVADGMGLS